MKYVFAGDRSISCEILSYMMAKGYKPEALLVSSHKINTHAEKLIKISCLEEEKVFYGIDFKTSENIAFLKSLEVDYIIGIHFPYIIPSEVLSIPKIGFLNLHPAYLPYNKGWNTPTWAIIDKTTYGATLHFMSEELDAGDVIHQKSINIQPTDTANSLYKRVLDLEKEVFVEAFNSLLTLKPNRIKQTENGTSYKKSDLQKVKQVDLKETVVVGDFIDRLRALTTNKKEEAVFFIKDGVKYSIQVDIKKIEDNE